MWERSPTDITLADFNNDGKLDFATATGTTALTVLFGNGIGGFGGRIDPPVLGATSAVAAATSTTTVTPIWSLRTVSAMSSPC